MFWHHERPPCSLIFVFANAAAADTLVCTDMFLFWFQERCLRNIEKYDKLVWIGEPHLIVSELWCFSNSAVARKFHLLKSPRNRVVRESNFTGI